MTYPNTKYEYLYNNNQLGHHHAYILKPLMEMMSEMLPPPDKQKPRILDIGCGNGSLSNFLWDFASTKKGTLQKRKSNLSR